MRIRTLVPALACLAAAPACLLAADAAPAPAPAPAAAAPTPAGAPAVKFDGYVDTIWSWADSKFTPDASNTSARGPQSGFNYFFKLGAEITVSDKVTGLIDLTNNNNAYTGDNKVFVRQAFGTWKVTPEITFRSGRFIDCIGWSSPYAPNLLRVNAGPEPGLYGVLSAVGADVTYAKGAWTLEASIVNDFFGSDTTGQTSQVTGQKNNGYAYIVDAAYTLPDKKGSLDAEAVYDVDAAANVVGATPVTPVIKTGGDYRGGDGYHLGVNATLTPSDPWKIGLEGIYQQIKLPKDALATGVAAQKNTGLLAQVNYTIPQAPWNAAVTGSAEYVKKSNVDLVEGSNSKQTEVALALLTNPAGSTNFGVNAEIGYTMAKTDATGTASVKDNTWAFTLEALYVIP